MAAPPLAKGLMSRSADLWSVHRPTERSTFYIDGKHCGRVHWETQQPRSSLLKFPIFVVWMFSFLFYLFLSFLGKGFLGWAHSVLGFFFTTSAPFTWMFFLFVSAMFLFYGSCQQMENKIIWKQHLPSGRWWTMDFGRFRWKATWSRNTDQL